MKIFDSSRTGHVTAAFAVGVGLLTVAITQNDPRILIAAVTVPAWEVLATPDMDIDTRSSRRGPWHRRLWVLWWKPYAKLVPHRSRWSHSLLFGLPLRFAWGSLPFLLALLLVPGPLGVARVYAEYWPWVLAGAAMADTLHMIKDGFGVGRIVFGK